MTEICSVTPMRLAVGQLCGSKRPSGPAQPTTKTRPHMARAVPDVDAGQDPADPAERRASRALGPRRLASLKKPRRSVASVSRRFRIDRVQRLGRRALLFLLCKWLFLHRIVKFYFLSTPVA
ncbi:hypothetical protein CTA1_5736 [Colletotrichum tanaceti]|uniref:Uncharacterized protein n=1 Tax=Colletotrichum tanaceti TaxID=1306861 RepID=A0A4U6XE84_9PEZI|nr:hypothetical protein CTA1_5736 [Colletotrichum tanaceti]